MVNMQVQGDKFRWIWSGVPGESFPLEIATARPLHIAAGMGHSHIVAILLEYGASVDLEDGGFATPLHHAASNGQSAMAQLLLDAGANPNALGSDLLSPCMYAAFNGHHDAIRILMKGGADIQLRSRDDETALQFAARYGREEVFKFLLSATANEDLGVEGTFGRSTLYDAICHKTAFSMSFLLNLVPQASAYESRRCTILNATIRNRSSTEVKMLLRRLPTGLLPILLNHRDLHGTPLYTAAVFSKADTVKLLLDTGAELELDGSEHGTPLMAACATGRLAAVRVLVARGARTSYVKDGQVFSAYAAARHHPQVKRWLLVGRFLEGPKLLMGGVAGQEG